MYCDVKDCVFNKGHTTQHSFEIVGHSKNQGEILLPMTHDQMQKLTFVHGDLESFFDMLRKIHEWHLIHDMSVSMQIILGKDL